LMTQSLSQRRIQHRIAERPCDCLQPLENVAVQERQIIDIVAGAATRSQLQVVEVAGLVQSVPTSWDAYVPVDSPSICPQPTGDLHRGGRPESCGAAGCKSDRAGAGLAGLGHARIGPVDSPTASTPARSTGVNGGP